MRSECAENQRTDGGATSADASRHPIPRKTPDGTNRDDHSVRNNASRDNGRRQTRLADFMTKPATASDDHPAATIADTHSKAETTDNGTTPSTTRKLRSHSTRTDPDIVDNEADQSSSSSGSESDSEPTMTMSSPETPTPPKAKNGKRKAKKRKMRSGKQM